MSASERYERSLPSLLEELSAPRTPDYFDDILGQVGRTRQRPGWTFPERWLPMSAVSERLTAVPRVPLRTLVVAALLLIALAVSLALLVGSQQHRVPAPFGPAQNGVIAFVDANGAIAIGNPLAGNPRVIIAGSGHDRPTYSPDGTRLAYLQAAELGRSDIVVANGDGASPRTVSAQPYSSVGYLGWTPDGQSVVAAIEPGRLLAFDLASGGEPTVLTDRIKLSGPFAGLDGFDAHVANVFRPPNGDEFLWTGLGPDGAGLYRQATHGGKPIAILTQGTSPVPFVDMLSAVWSPDGAQIAVTLLLPDADNDWKVYVMNADGSRIRPLTHRLSPGTVVSEAHPQWSPDGTRIAIMRWFDTGQGGGTRAATIVDVATGNEREVGDVAMNGFLGGSAWSPDGLSLLELPGDGSAATNHIIVVNVATGTSVDSGLWSGTAISWQRVAP
jgi:Tol biopolymer transport system component